MPEEPQEEPLAHRRKRLYMRSIRRGIKEMDLILTSYADARLPAMEEAALDSALNFDSIDINKSMTENILTGKVGLIIKLMWIIRTGYRIKTPFYQ